MIEQVFQNDRNVFINKYEHINSNELLIYKNIRQLSIEIQHERTKNTTCVYNIFYKVIL